ncbi:MAG: ion transporter [Bacteroidales bacterium]
MKKLFLNDRFILTLILTNALIIFIQSFDGISDVLRQILFVADNLLTLAFVFEIIIKIRECSFRVYYKSNWNKFDFYLVAFSFVSVVLSLITHDFENLSFILVLRVLRVARIFKAFRFLRYVPNIDQLLLRTRRALKASILVIFALVVYNFTLAVFSCHLFKDIAPQYFGNPLESLYTIFRVFSVEGWYEIPDYIAENSSTSMALLAKIYFVLVLFSGGVIGLSLINSIFVDAMIADNNKSLEYKVDELNNKLLNLPK